MKKQNISLNYNTFQSLLFLCLLTACSSGFNAPHSASNSSNPCLENCAASSGDSSNNNSGNNGTANSWSQVDMDGTVADNIFVSGKVIQVDQASQTITLSLPLPAVATASSPMVNIPVPNVPGGSVGLIHDAQGKWVIGATIPLKDVLRGVKMGDPLRLPNGNPLPGIPSGELPGLSVLINKGEFNVDLYLGIDAVALFIPIKNFNSFVDFTLPVTNKKGQVIGYFSAVAAVGTSPGGIYVSTVIPNDIARIIDSLL